MNLRTLITEIHARKTGMLRASSRAAMLMTGLVAQRVFSILISVYVARVLGAEAFGEFTMFVTLFIIFSEMPRAIDNTYVRFANVGGKDDVSSDLMINLLLKSLFVIASISAAFFLSPFMANYLFNKPETSDLISAGISVGSMYGMSISLAAFYQQQHKFKQVALFRPVFQALVGSALLILFINGEKVTVDNVLQLHLYVAIFMCIAAILFLSRFISTMHFPGLADIKKQLHVAGVIASAMAIRSVSARLDIFIVGSLATMVELGAYGAAVRTAMIAAIFTGAVATIMLPRASQALESHTSYKRYLRLSGFYMFLQTIIAVIIVLLCDSIIRLLFGVEYESVVTIAVLLTIQTVLTAYAVPYRALIQCSSKPSVLILTASLALVSNAVLINILMPKYGILGAAVGMVATSALVLIVILFLASKLASIHLEQSSPVLSKG